MSKYTRPPLWIFPVVYGLHLLDEGLVAGSLPRWATQHGFPFTVQHWLLVSSISFVVFCAAVALVARGVWPRWLLVSLAVHVSLHGLAHLGASVWMLSLSPGALSGAALALPLGLWTFSWATREFERRLLILGIAIGAISFQAPWDIAVRLVLGSTIWTV